MSTNTKLLSKGPGSSVGIASRYGLDGPGIESQCGVRFPAPVQTSPVAQPASYTMGTGTLSPGVKRPGRGVVRPPSSSDEVEGRVELSLWVFVDCSRVNLTFTFTSK